MDIECGEENRKYAYVNGLDSDRRKRQADNFGPFPVYGGFSDTSEDSLESLKPRISKVFDLMKSQHTDFNFELNRIIKSKSQVVAGIHAITTVEAVRVGDVKQCVVDYTTNLKQEIVTAHVTCDHHDKSFHYAKEE